MKPSPEKIEALSVWLLKQMDLYMTWRIKAHKIAEKILTGEWEDER